MAKFSEQFIQQVVQATDIVELVGQYVALKKRGKEFVGLCPFHDDHKPSMYVSPAKQIFKCFACGVGGGAYQFLMLQDKLTFPEAVRSLADRAGIPLPQLGPADRQAGDGLAKDDLMQAVAFAAGFYRLQLKSTAGKAALDYAHGRGLTDQSIERFALGYAPDSWDSLIRAAGKQGISQARLVAAGLASRREGGTGCYDRFRNRLIFPIFDPQNRAIAFGGRALDEAERAKYLNSPESTVFDKSSQLYALNWSREAVVATGQAVVVEGYLDALIPLQADVKNVVATLGTALTDRHVRLLCRYAREAVLVFDSDTAGRAAAERALEVMLAQQLHVRVATIPAGKDPCDYCLSAGGEGLAKLIDAAPDALQYVWQRRQADLQAAGENLADRGRLVEEFLNLVVSSAAYGAIDEMRRGQLAQHIAHLLNIPAADLQQQMRRLARRITRRSRHQEGPAASAQASGRGVLAEQHLLEVLLNCPDLFDHADERLDPQDFTSEQYRQVAQCLWTAGRAGRLNLEELLAQQRTASLGGLITGLAISGQRRGNYQETLDGAVDYILYRRGRQDLQVLQPSSDSDRALRELTRRGKNADLRRHPKVR